MLKIFKVSKAAHSSIQTAIAGDAFARNGYIYREGTTLGLKGADYYLYVEAPETFFTAQAEAFKMKGVKELTGKNFTKVKGEIEKEQDNVATGLSLFD